MKILVADDEPDIVMLYKIGLEERGHEVIVTKDGEECLKVYREALKATRPKRSSSPPFDLVILDYRMPGKNGIEVAKEIQQLNPMQRITFVSAYVMEKLVKEVKVLEQDVDLIDKPFEFDSFASWIEEDVVIAANGSVHEQV